jgi:hypothetical protein
MRTKEPTTLETTVANLAADVDYWKARALKAENELRVKQESDIKAAGLWEQYCSMLGVFGKNPATSTEPVV